MNKPEIVCMCGSVKFAEVMTALSWEIEKAGNIVLRVNDVPSWYKHYAGVAEEDQVRVAEHQQVRKVIDALHLNKILLCDRVFICDVDGYIGNSVAEEIEYALANKKRVSYLNGSKPPHINTLDKSGICKNEFTEIGAKIVQWWKNSLKA